MDQVKGEVAARRATALGARWSVPRGGAASHRLVAGAAALALVMALAGPASASAAAPGAGSQWARFGGPNPGPFTNLMSGIAAISDSDVWGVGFFMDGRATDHTLAEHWDGAAWSRVPTPDAGQASQLIATAALATDDVWAVGVEETRNDAQQRTLTEHWDGTSWTVVPSPNPPTAGSFTELTAVTAIAADDVWAAGWFENAAQDTTDALFEHWDGTAWTIVPGGATSARFAFLWGISASSANDIWAVGTDQTTATYRTFVEHWDGTRWTVVPTPNAGGSNELAAVTALADDDAWLVGSSHTETSAQTLTEHWDGASWTVVPSPNQGAGQNHLYGTTSLRGDDVWAVGSFADPRTGFQRTLTEQWDGSAWRIVPSPNAGTSVTLFAADTVGASTVWVAGTAIQPPQLRTFFLRTGQG
jgi:hypothetical protein